MIVKLKNIFSPVVCFVIFIQFFLVCLFLESLFDGSLTDPDPKSDVGTGLILISLLYSVITTLIILPVSLFCWLKKLKNNPSRKRIILIRIFIMDWVLLAFLCYLAWSYIYIKYDQYEDKVMLEHSSLISLNETPIELNKLPIGVHLAFQIEMPAEWQKKYPICNATFNLYLFNVADPRLSIESNNAHESCTLSPDQKTYHVQFEGDYYSSYVKYAKDNTVCAPYNALNLAKKPKSPSSFSGSYAFVGYNGFNIIFPDDPVAAPIKSLMIEKMKMTLSRQFWKEANQNLTSENFLADGYHGCHHKVFSDPNTSCYCK